MYYTSVQMRMLYGTIKHISMHYYTARDRGGRVLLRAAPVCEVRHVVGQRIVEVQADVAGEAVAALHAHH
jgi:hypothetical protein